MLNITTEVQELINRGALFVINDSGGKDSQAMKVLITQAVPHNQLLIIHSHLPEVEWDGSVEHITANAQGVPVKVVTAVKTFLDMVEHRGAFPSPKYRQCTSDLKRGPLEKGIREELKARGLSLVVNCMGMRAQESNNRAKLEVLKLNNRNSKAGREWYDWLPIHHLTTREVFLTIKNAGQRPFWTYAEGMERKSCVFCIMASDNDIKTASRLKPELAKRYMDLEERLGVSMQMPRGGKPRFLKDIINS